MFLFSLCPSSPQAATRPTKTRWATCSSGARAMASGPSLPGRRATRTRPWSRGWACRSPETSPDPAAACSQHGPCASTAAARGALLCQMEMRRARIGVASQQCSSHVMFVFLFLCVGRSFPAASFRPSSLYFFVVCSAWSNGKLFVFGGEGTGIRNDLFVHTIRTQPQCSSGAARPSRWPINCSGVQLGSTASAMADRRC